MLRHSLRSSKAKRRPRKRYTPSARPPTRDLGAWYLKSFPTKLKVGSWFCVPRYCFSSSQFQLSIGLALNYFIWISSFLWLQRLKFLGFKINLSSSGSSLPLSGLYNLSPCVGKKRRICKWKLVLLDSIRNWSSDYDVSMQEGKR